VAAKPISIKPTGGKSGGCALKAVELTSGDLLSQKSAKGVVLQNSGGRPERYPIKGIKGRASKRRNCPENFGQAVTHGSSITL
jgi:hypothetical protein